TVLLDARNFSLLIPKLSIYDAAHNLVATTSATTYGSVLSLTLTGLVAGQTYTIQAGGATSDVFPIGAYQLTIQFGGLSPALPPTTTNPTSPPSSGSTGAFGTNLVVTQPPPANLGYVAGALAHSAEYYSNFVTAAYKHYLERTPAPSEVNSW